MYLGVNNCYAMTQLIHEYKLCIQNILMQHAMQSTIPDLVLSNHLEQNKISIKTDLQTVIRHSYRTCQIIRIIFFSDTELRTISSAFGQNPLNFAQVSLTNLASDVKCSDI